MPTRKKKPKLRRVTREDIMDKVITPLVNWQIRVINDQVTPEKGVGYWAVFDPPRGRIGFAFWRKYKVSRVRVFNSRGPLNTPWWATHVLWKWH